MLSYTYTSLALALHDWPVIQNNAQFEAHIREIIGLGELRLVRDLNLEIFDGTTDPTGLLLAANSRLVTKPADMITTRTIRLVLAGAELDVELRSWDFCHTYAPNPTAVAQPIYFNELSSTQWEFVDTADVQYGVLCHYVRRPAGLADGDANTPTWLSGKVPDALFAACLMEAEHFLKADDRYTDYQTKYYQELLPVARSELRNLIRMGDAGPFKAPSGPTQPQQ